MRERQHVDLAEGEADNCGMSAASATDRHIGPTAGFTIDFLRPVEGGTVVARAVAARGGRTRAVGRCDVFAVIEGQERPCAVPQGTTVSVPRPTARPTDQ